MCQVSRPATFRNYMCCDERQERWLLELLATATAVARRDNQQFCHVRTAEPRRAPTLHAVEDGFGAGAGKPRMCAAVRIERHDDRCERMVSPTCLKGQATRPPGGASREAIASGSPARGGRRRHAGAEVKCAVVAARRRTRVTPLATRSCTRPARPGATGWRGPRFLRGCARHHRLRPVAAPAGPWLRAGFAAAIGDLVGTAAPARGRRSSGAG